MLQIRDLKIPDYEKVIEVKDPESGLHGFIAVHSTILGPSLGGIRMYPYSSPEAALEDVLRLSKGMSYKSALANTGLGGGKSVIIGDPKKNKTEALLLSFAEAINTLEGTYIGAEDMGMTTNDMLILRKKTPFVSALPLASSSGDPSHFTTFGVLKGMDGMAQFMWHSPFLKGKSIAIQGLGSVGSKLAHTLFWEGAELILTDIDQELAEREAVRLGARTVPPDEIYDVPCDIFAPCAVGGILNKDTIPRLNCTAVAGSANNQLRTLEDATLLSEKGIIYAPDYVLNAGGIINVSCEFDSDGYDPRNAREKTANIYNIIITICDRAKREHKTTAAIADEIAEYNLKHKVGKRKHPIVFANAKTTL